MGRGAPIPAITVLLYLVGGGARAGMGRGAPEKFAKEIFFKIFFKSSFLNPSKMCFSAVEGKRGVMRAPLIAMRGALTTALIPARSTPANLEFQLSYSPGSVWGD